MKITAASLAFGVAASAAAAAAALPTVAGGTPAMAQPRHSPELPRARDGDVAIREEFDAARRAGTREAYDLFIARHPDHPLARTAQDERARLK